MRQNQFQEDIKLNNAIETTAPTQDLGQPTLSARLNARIFAAKYDRQVEAGAVPTPGSPLAAHVARLSTVREREHVARAFRHVLQGGEKHRPGVQLRMPVLSSRVNECRSVIDDVTLRLHSPRPVDVKGVARLRILLSDGTGPLYFQGRGSLGAELRGALAAM